VSNDSGLEILKYGRGDPPRLLRDTLSQKNLALSSPTNGGSSVGIVRSRTQTTELVRVGIYRALCSATASGPNFPGAGNE
jgi:hypothetical protein